MAKMQFKTRYDYESMKDESGLKCDPKQQAVQSCKDECDINKIMKRFQETGNFGLPTDDLTSRKPQFGDFSNIGDYMTVLTRVQKLDAEFMKLPANTRAKFNHDPKSLLDYIADSKNYKEAVKLGILDPSVLKETPEDPASGAAIGTANPSGTTDPAK